MYAQIRETVGKAICTITTRLQIVGVVLVVETGVRGESHVSRLAHVAGTGRACLPKAGKCTWREELRMLMEREFKGGSGSEDKEKREQFVGHHISL